MEIVEWLKENDQSLFARKARVSEAIKECEKVIGRKVKSKEFKGAREYCCKYWKKMRRRRESRETATHVRKWNKIRVWAKSHVEQIRECESLFVVSQLMIAAGIPVSETILSNSTSFMEVWQQTHS